MELRFAAAGNGKVLQDFRLERGSKTFHTADTIFLRRRFELRERGDTERFMELQYLVRPETRKGKKFQQSFRDFLAQFFKAGMRSSLVKLRHDVGDRVTDTGNVGKHARGDDAVQWLRKGAEAVGCLEVSLRAVGIAAAER